MSDRSGIEWTDATWNPVTGCTKVSPGCDHCYAETIHERFHGKGSFATVTLAPHRLTVPLSWRKPRRVFVNSMSDLFHDDVPDEYIARVWSTMRMSSRHTFQVLTKRHARMKAWLNRCAPWSGYITHNGNPSSSFGGDGVIVGVPEKWPLPNVWLGVSAEDQKWADIRIPALLDTPAAVRWISAEPLLGPINLGKYVQAQCECCDPAPGRPCVEEPASFSLDWVVVGGESGPGARPMNPEWAHFLRDQCVAAEVPFLFKQWGAHDVDGKRVGKGRAGRMLDGRTWDGYPAVTP
jgi:protein gp37